jgi:hypothetical protein
MHEFVVAEIDTNMAGITRGPKKNEIACFQSNPSHRYSLFDLLFGSAGHVHAEYSLIDSLYKT